MTWYRGFFRLWLACTVLWIAGLGTWASYMTSENAAFNAREKGTQAAPALGRNLSPDLDFIPDPPADPPHRPADIEAVWFLCGGVPLGSLMLLRTLAWIVKGFRP